ncbi:VanZ family protein [Microbacterium testaceum]|uniref:VanZ family protein n=1 Tax=Microbacterium testaceum TaxID=2033 RepID=UPI0025B1232D|nr:VanZ family protein [Microbacterium testaceum]WJS92175.1 VanZ family protein [Microbacterium testaceum]
MSARSIFTPARVLTAGAVLAAVVALTLAPRAIAWPARTLVLDALDHLPPSWSALVLGAGADVALNIAFFVPLGAAIALLLPLRWAPASLLLCALVSLAVEALQAGIPGRVPDAEDVVSNTIGAAIGTVVVIAVRLTARGAGRR